MQKPVRGGIRYKKKPTPMKSKLRQLTTAVCGVILALPIVAKADTSFTVSNTTADAFLASGSPNNPVGTNLTTLNFGGAGTFAIAPASSTKRDFDSVVKINLAGAP